MNSSKGASQPKSEGNPNKSDSIFVPQTTTEEGV